jgi:hypothetical protein
MSGMGCIFTFRKMNLFVFLPAFFFFSFAAPLTAQNSDSLSKNNSGFFIDAFAGFPSYSNFGRNMEAVELSTGSGPIAWTGRFYRGKGNHGYLFEDALEIGWRKEFASCLTNTVSAGYSNLAFEKPFFTGPEISSWNFTKADGFVVEEKICYSFPGKNHSGSPWGIAGNYYYIFNPHEPVQGFSLGIDLMLENMYWQHSGFRKKKEKQKSPGKSDQGETNSKPVDTNSEKPKFEIPYHYRIRTNFITGIIFSPHIDFEHRFSKRWGWGFGFSLRPKFNQERGILRLFENPDFQLKGYAGFADWILYMPLWKNDHYFTFGLRCGYRNLSGTCAIGDKIMSPDYYIYRERQDIVSALRVSFIMPPEGSHSSIDWYFTIGARTSFYNSRVLDPHLASYFNSLNGCYVLPEFAGGLEIGFGW